MLEIGLLVSEWRYRVFNLMSFENEFKMERGIVFFEVKIMYFILELLGEIEVECLDVCLF